MYDDLTYEDKMCLITDYMTTLNNKKQREFYEDISTNMPMPGIVDAVLEKIDLTKKQAVNAEMDMQDTRL